MIKRIIAIALCLTIVVSLVACGNPSTFLLQAAMYPEQAPYPNEDYYLVGDHFDDESLQKDYDKYFEDFQKIRSMAEGAIAPEAFYNKSIREYLSGAPGENIAYSPLNVYMALAMLAETTAGESRAQILELLDCKDIEGLRNNAQALWYAAYSDDGLLTTQLGSSVWLRDDCKYNKDVFKRLAEYYLASSYSGEMGSPEYDKELQDWINSRTKEFLSEQVPSAKLPAETVMALCTTIYFKGKWIDVFSKERTDKMVFHGADRDNEVDFMHGTFTTTVFGTDKFTAFTKPFNGNANMTFILPDEGISIDDLVNDEAAMSFITASSNSKFELDTIQLKTVELTLSLPKFDIMSDISLSDGLKKLGVTDVFDDMRADFSPVTKEQLVLSDTLHSARVKIDEEGCEAAAYSLFLCGTTAFVDREELELVFDRPFIFTINDKSGNLIFVGVVNYI